MEIIDSSDFVIFLGKPCTGKSRMLDIITEVSNQFITNPSIKEIYYSKIFPKAYNKGYLFSEVEVHSKVQFYSNNLIFKSISDVYFYNIIKELNERVLEFQKKLYPQSEIELQSNKEKVDYSKILKILYFDGQIDSEWTENLNLLSNEKKIHCFPNSDKINLNDCRIYFESNNLLHASPTFVKYIYLTLHNNRFPNRQ